MLRPLLDDPGGISIVVGTPFIYIESKRMLVLSDLHLGFEEAASKGLFYSLRRSGGYYSVFVPRIQLRRTINMLQFVLENIAVKRVVINGDLKHAFDQLLKQEKDETTRLIEFLKERGVEDAIVIRGNHDNFIKPVLRRLGVSMANALTLNIGDKKILITHGHEKYSTEEHDVVIIGHEHPSLRCFDSYRFPSFMKISLPNRKTLVVMPATSPYHPGVSITPVSSEYLSPYIKNLDSLNNMSITIWIDLGEVTRHGVEYMESISEPGLMRVDRFLIGNKEYAIVEFSSYDVAFMVCQV